MSTGFSEANDKPPSAAITPIASIQPGAPVSLHGKVHKVTDDDEFILRDETGRVEVYIGWKNQMPVKKGDAVTVHGVADDDVRPGKRPDIYASRLVLSGGQEVVLLPDGG